VPIQINSDLGVGPTVDGTKGFGWGRGQDSSPFVSQRDRFDLKPIGNRVEVVAAALFNRHALIATGATCLRLDAGKKRPVK
jgi:hypothetical protein